eukprot:365487-Chlamydomonas_euryale.AAC.3
MLLSRMRAFHGGGTHARLCPAYILFFALTGFPSRSTTPQEDAVFRAATELALDQHLPLVYLAANSGARVGLANEVGTQGMTSCPRPKRRAGQEGLSMAKGGGLFRPTLRAAPRTQATDRGEGGNPHLFLPRPTCSSPGIATPPGGNAWDAPAGIYLGLQHPRPAPCIHPSSFTRTSHGLAPMACTHGHPKP